MIYLDSSVALAYLLAEDRYPPKALWHQPIVRAAARMRSLESDQCASASRIARRCRPRLDRPDRDHRNGAAGVEARPRAVSDSSSHAGRHSPGGHRVHPFPGSKRPACQLRRTTGRGCTSARNCRVERKLNNSTHERAAASSSSIGLQFRLKDRSSNGNSSFAHSIFSNSLRDSRISSETCLRWAKASRL